MNSFDVRVARMETLLSVAKKFPFRDLDQIREYVEAVAEDAYPSNTRWRNIFTQNAMDRIQKELDL